VSAPVLRVRHIIEALDKHRVEYVLIGGYAATVDGASRPTYDIDIVIKSKEAVGRDKDTVALPELYQLARRADPRH
jgi:predicted nucleotidyltransferase